mmetsp:Transcript_3458/g.3578  ORF Transcript_3458/g.3578 Transcript_3458/m.3578 type:complete len:96 (+) Transcript_3458:345-632(+)
MLLGSWPAPAACPPSPSRASTPSIRWDSAHRELVVTLGPVAGVGPTPEESQRVLRAQCDLPGRAPVLSSVIDSICKPIYTSNRAPSRSARLAHHL